MKAEDETQLPGVGPQLVRAVFCPNCNQWLPPSDDAMTAYFESVTMYCPHCNEPVDWWETVLKAIHEPAIPVPLLSVVGGHASSLQVRLPEGKVTAVRLATSGVPEDARIFDIIYTPIGPDSETSVTPVELQGSGGVHRRRPTNQVHLYPVPLGPDPKRFNEVTVNVLVLWAHSNASDEVTQLLVDAVFGFGQYDYKAAVLAAHTAVDLMLDRVVVDFLNRVNKNQQKQLSYPLKLSILQGLARLASLTQLPSHITELLMELNSQRNNVAHPRRKGQLGDAGKVSQYVTAGLFGVGYLRMVEPRFLKFTRPA